ncbi:tripartite tricarboxylate transporter substrate-binding protein [Roseomonas sp. CCTCC AB2023176]|uniref:tripartite tricarboxylate transporter substrate-binding protein n=1 Tax=Roseomonas sp. CCTCC AB2023176 TaxID=3342640 RepID=UPI0035D99807
MLRTPQIIPSRRALFTAPLVAALPRNAVAAWPERPVRLLVGFAPGGTVDTMARVLAQGLSGVLGQQVIVENRPGAAANIAAEAVAKGPADGSQLLYAVFSHAVAPALLRLSYDPLADLVGVSQVVRVPVFLLASPRAPFSTVPELVAAARAAPGTISYASGGVGSSAHLAGELLARRAGISLVHVPFRGGGPAAQALLAGDVPLLLDTPTTALRSFLAEGRMKGLAVMAEARQPAYPAVPAIAEAGLGARLEVQTWQGILVRAGTPPEIVETLHRAILQVMAMPETLSRVEALAVEAAPSDPAAFTAFFRAEVRRWTAIAREAGITAG